jgi:hypothetical protein
MLNGWKSYLQKLLMGKTQQQQQNNNTNTNTNNNNNSQWRYSPDVHKVPLTWFHSLS